MRKEKVSSAVIRRLPRYFRHLTELNQNGVVRISSSALGKAMNLTASQIRQDLSCFGEFGQQGYGYNVANLLGEVREILGMNRDHTAVLVGIGNLGNALISKFSFSDSGFTLTAAFDRDPELVGKVICNTPVYHVDTLEAYLADHPTSVGILTVPRSVAQGIADRLTASGVRGIWNFTNADVMPKSEGVFVEDVHFSDSLQMLSYKISEDL